MSEPTLAWLTTILYAVGGILALFASRRAGAAFDSRTQHLLRLLWLASGIGLLLLALNKPLDFHSSFTAWVKTLAARGGWYAYGQQAQEIFIYVLAAAALIALTWLAWSLRRAWRQCLLLLVGLLFLARFILVRAGIFYGVPMPSLSWLSGGIAINWALEPLGAALILISAVYVILTAKPANSSKNQQQAAKISLHG